MADEKQTHTLGQDPATKSVRPADARYNRVEFTPEQLKEIREQEIQEGYERLAEKAREEDEANQKALEESGYVNPTVAPSEHAEARNKAAASTGGDKPADSKPATKTTPSK